MILCTEPFIFFTTVVEYNFKSSWKITTSGSQTSLYLCSPKNRDSQMHNSSKLCFSYVHFLFKSTKSKKYENWGSTIRGSGVSVQGSGVSESKKCFSVA